MKNILVVDGSRFSLLGLSLKLCVHLKDCNVLTADDGRKALDMMKFLPVDCLVTGLEMTSIDGYELVRSVRKNDPTLPVLIMTAAGGPEMERKLVSLGALRCVAKPPDFKKLAGLIASELSARSLAA